MVTVGWLDPSMGTRNAGDEIIAASVGAEMGALGLRDFRRLPTQRAWDRRERRAARDCDYFVVGGTNLLTSHPFRYRQWRVGYRDFALLRKRTILFGVGWWQYQAKPDPLGQGFLTQLLHPDALHSVRDNYTVSQLSSIGCRVHNTACPTMWRVPRQGRSHRGFRGTVLATVTDYLPDPVRDRQFVAALLERANQVSIWPQGEGDAEYVRRIGFGDLLIAPGLASFDAALGDPQVEYVGTRLHAGIRALQYGRPSVIIAVDNRAREISSDTGLWTIDRSQAADTSSLLERFDSWDLSLPSEAIEQWRHEFASLTS